MKHSRFFRLEVRQIANRRTEARVADRCAASCARRGDRIGAEYHRVNAKMARDSLRGLRLRFKEMLRRAYGHEAMALLRDTIQARVQYREAAE